jgi:hypothetical protein
MVSSRRDKGEDGVACEPYVASSGKMDMAKTGLSDSQRLALKLEGCLYQEIGA